MAKRAERERKVAEARAKRILLRHLDAEQRRDYERDGRFRLIKGERVYEVVRGRAHNVFLLDEQGRRAIEYCGHVSEHVPNDDNVLAQKLLLEHREEEFLKIANSRRLVAA